MSFLETLTVRELNNRLLADLAKLATRYPPEDFQRLAAVLANEEGLNTILTILRGAGQLSETLRPKRTSTKTLAQRLIAGFRDTDPQKYDILSGFLSASRHGVFKRRDHLYAFATSLGIKVLPQTAASDVLAQVVEQLAALPLEGIKDKLQQSIGSERNFSAEYQQWARLILGQRKL
jgi:hypothetical protein